MRYHTFVPVLTAAVLALAGSNAVLAKAAHTGGQFGGFHAVGVPGAALRAESKPVAEAAYRHNKLR
jgi:hypothetical protein